MKYKWAICPKCGHKFFKVIEAGQNLTAIEIKCHSCKWTGIVLIKATSDNKQDKL